MFNSCAFRHDLRRRAVQRPDRRRALISFITDCSWKRNVAMTGFDDLDGFACHLSNKT